MRFVQYGSDARYQLYIYVTRIGAFWPSCISRSNKNEFVECASRCGIGASGARLDHASIYVWSIVTRIVACLVSIGYYMWVQGDWY